ncbi:hypothetical protein LIER_17349 [Lithospermum erythrorhizon]|uniref:Glutaredoxin domain-containing protein n=1 Tax=Lithospermum erythrorhizon TaxID=34254 RepID=A0AAV3QCD0_LITER
MDTINKLVGSRPLVIFSKSNCCISHTIVTLICSFGANPTVYELDELPNGEQLQQALEAALGQRANLFPCFKKAKAIWV